MYNRPDPIGIHPIARLYNKHTCREVIPGFDAPRQPRSQGFCKECRQKPWERGWHQGWREVS